MSQERTPEEHRHRSLLARFRANFLTGLMVVMPIGLTVWLIWKVIGWIDGWVLPMIPHAWRPEALVNYWFGPYITYWFGEGTVVGVRGVGVVIFLLFTVGVGWIAKGLIGRSTLALGESFVNRMPIVRSVYSGLKQIAESVFSQGDAKFDKACLVEFPRKGIWAVGFVSTAAKGEIDEILTVFLATNLLPPSGFLIYVPRSDVILLDRMSIEDAAKLIISAGLVYPSADRDALARPGDPLAPPPVGTAP
jgi:uncharacterized membrane protein